MLRGGGLMRLITVALFCSMAGCAYVTKEEFEQYWDKDGDGWPLGEDCNDDNKDVHPYAADVRGDGCDSDCSTEKDDDNDDWPNSADCAPDDPTIYPCSDSEKDGDGIDSDCDGADSVRTVQCVLEDPDFQDAKVMDEDCPEAQQVP